MALLALFLYVIGCALLAYGFSLVYAPLLPLTLGVCCLGSAIVKMRDLR